MHGKHIRPHESLSKLPFRFEVGARSAQEQEVDLWSISLPGIGVITATWGDLSDSVTITVME